MKFTGEALLQAPLEAVWDSILDPAVLVQTIPGCERLVTTDENAYDMTVTTGVAAVRGTYAGSCRLSDLVPRESLVMQVEGAGAPGTLSATVNVGFADAGGGSTRLTYDADAIVGGMVGGVGQRMLTSVSRRMAGEFFGNVNNVLTGAAPAAVPVGAGAPGAGPAGAPAGPPAPGQVFTAPPAAPRVGSSDDFLKGLVVGAGLVLLGVVAGGILGRRR